MPNDRLTSLARGSDSQNVGPTIHFHSSLRQIETLKVWTRANLFGVLNKDFFMRFNPTASEGLMIVELGLTYYGQSIMGGAGSVIFPKMDVNLRKPPFNKVSNKYLKKGSGERSTMVLLPKIVVNLVKPPLNKVIDKYLKTKSPLV